MKKMVSITGALTESLGSCDSFCWHKTCLKFDRLIRFRWLQRFPAIPGRTCPLGKLFWNDCPKASSGFDGSGRYAMGWLTGYWVTCVWQWMTIPIQGYTWRNSFPRKFSVSFDWLWSFICAIVKSPGLSHHALLGGGPQVWLPFFYANPAIRSPNRKEPQPGQSSNQDNSDTSHAFPIRQKHWD